MTEIIVNRLGIFQRAQACSLVDGGGAPGCDPEAHHILQAGMLREFQGHRSDHTVTGSDGALALHRWWNDLNHAMCINAQSPLWAERNHNTLSFARGDDFLGGFTHVVWLRQFAL